MTKLKCDACSCAYNNDYPEMVVGCEATNCVYNENHECDASEICISGDHACKPRETECATFHCK